MISSPKMGRGRLVLLYSSILIVRNFAPPLKTKILIPFGMKVSTSTFLIQTTYTTSILKPMSIAIIEQLTPKPSSERFLSGTSFVPYSDAVVLHYPLEKRNLLSRVKGELGLKVFVTDEPSIKISNPLPAMDSSLHTDSRSTGPQASARVLPSINIFSNDKAEKNISASSQPKATTAATYFCCSTTADGEYGAHEMKAESLGPRIVPMFCGSSSQPPDYALKETSPFLGGGRVVVGRVIRADKPSGTYDLVEQMGYLFVRVVKARDLPSMDVTGSLDPFVEVKLGNYKGITKHFEKKQNPEWNEVFAFARDIIQSSVLEVVVKDKDTLKDDFVGFVRFDLHEVPSRVPPDSPLAPEWYRLENKKGEKKKGELMLAVWYGTQADEAFPEA